MKLFPKTRTSKFQGYVSSMKLSPLPTPIQHGIPGFPFQLGVTFCLSMRRTPALAGLAAVLVVVDYQMAPKLAFVLEFLRQLLQLRFSCSKSRHDGARAGASASPPAPVGSGVAESGAHAPA
jgi:hypothetical protein